MRPSNCTAAYRAAMVDRLDGFKERDVRRLLWSRRCCNVLEALEKLKLYQEALVKWHKNKRAGLLCIEPRHEDYGISTPEEKFSAQKIKERVTHER